MYPGLRKWVLWSSRLPLPGLGGGQGEELCGVWGEAQEMRKPFADIEKLAPGRPALQPEKQTQPVCDYSGP